MYNTTVTVFNLYRSKQLGTATWYPHVLSGCYFNADKAANVEKTGLENADSARLHIPYRVENRKVLLKGLESKDFKYLMPKEWDDQTNDMYENTVTFTEGEDFFLVGEFPEIPIDDSVYRGGVFSYLNSTRDQVYRINTVGKYELIPHFEIGGA